MRRRQESARRRLADAFSAMSAYIQRYRCQESEFDLGAALMNPMADCESVVIFFKSHVFRFLPLRPRNPRPFFTPIFSVLFSFFILYAAAAVVV